MLAPLKRPALTSLVAVLFLALSLQAATGLKIDTRADAFIAPDNPALAYREQVQTLFGLSDPLVVAVVSEQPEGIYLPVTLELIRQLNSDLSKLPNIDATSIVSLASEKTITGSIDGLDVEQALPPSPLSGQQASNLSATLARYPLYHGSLVSRDGQATLIVAELETQDLAAQTYRDTLELIARLELPEGVTAHVAGEAAIAGYLGTYIDADAKRLNPIAGLVIVLALGLAYRRLAAPLLAVSVILAAVGSALGAMALAGIPFYVITNALPVILIGIAVADAIHLFNHFFALQRENPDANRRTLMERTLVALWQPISITSLTTVAGFTGLYLASDMPPFKYFGLFCALGVIVAWLYTLIFLPALVLISGLNRPPERAVENRFRNLLNQFGSWLVRSSGISLTLCGATMILGLVAAGQLRVDGDRITLFAEQEPIRVADHEIKRHMAGSTPLDIVVESPHPEGLLNLQNLKRIEALQAFAAKLPNVGATSSLVDHVKMMNRAMHEDAEEAYTLPDKDNAVAQYFLLYSLSGEPDDFEAFVDYDYQNANVRLLLHDGAYSSIAPVVEALQGYIDQHFAGTELSATVTGRASLNYFWLKNVSAAHFQGLVYALLLVALVASLSFRSLAAGIITLIPVSAAVLAVYAYMVISGITLEIGTSMFAAVAVGLGVDFAIHTLHRLRVLYREMDGDFQRMMPAFFNATGSALLLSAVTVTAGFAVLLFSSVSQLRDFGAIVALALGVSFAFSILVTPALLQLLKPAFLHRDTHRSPVSPSVTGAIVVLAVLIVSGPNPAHAEEAVPLSASQVITNVNAVPEGEQLTRTLTMTLTDKRGKQRTRTTISYRKNYADEKRTAMYYLAPANVRDTAFLLWDKYDPQAQDEQWLFIPALRKVRRVSASDRGDYFLGTDFTYEDIKLDSRLNITDYNYQLVEITGNATQMQLSATAKSAEVAAELGYNRTLITINKANWVITRIEFWDTNDAPLKTLTASDIRQVDGIWTRHELLMENSQTGHTTLLKFNDVDYATPISDRLFTRQALARGH
jgi:predicted RND superfamily exporter protein